MSYNQAENGEYVADLNFLSGTKKSETKTSKTKLSPGLKSHMD